MNKCFVSYRYEISQDIKDHLKSLTPDFGFDGFGEVTYYRTYSRIMKDGNQECWADTVIRVVEGVLSIRKDWYIKHGLPVKIEELNSYAERLCDAIFHMRMLPPGRGLWAMGTDFVFEKGSMALNNCAAVEIKSLSKDLNWAMDALMCGVGVGFGIFRENSYELKKPTTYDDFKSSLPVKNAPKKYIIPDTREGWVKSLEILLKSYEDGSGKMSFDYSKIRPYGALIKGFGGKASGPDPLIKLHERVRTICDRYIAKEISWTRLCADLSNSIGSCVVAGNVRRSAEILLGHISDNDFINLKNYDKISDHVIVDGQLYQCTEYHKCDLEDPEQLKKYWMCIGKPSATDLRKYKYPEHNKCYDGRSSIGWMSNNTVRLEKKSDFRDIPKIAKLISINGEPGIINLVNMQKYGRFGHLEEDRATLANPCAEIGLESYELCNLAETFATRCKNKKEFYDALELASFYCSTVSLLPTHRPETNEVVNRNHRIGISISGIADWFDYYGAADCIPMLRKGYKIVKRTNEKLAKEAGIQPSIRVTTVKPSGSISQLAGVSSGMHFPTFQHAIRRIRIAEGSEIAPVLAEAGVPWEYDATSDSTYVFEFPIDQGKTRPAEQVSAWEQFSLLATLQREWADNMVSCTIYFDPESEGNQLEHMLGQFVPTIKSVSMFPHTKAGSYAQMPYEGIDKEEYERRHKELSTIDWDDFRGSDGQDSRFCTNDSCTVMPVSTGD